MDREEDQGDGLSEEQVKPLLGSDARKVVLARLVSERTTVQQGWIAAQLWMGARRTSASRSGGIKRTRSGGHFRRRSVSCCVCCQAVSPDPISPTLVPILTVGNRLFTGHGTGRDRSVPDMRFPALALCLTTLGACSTTDKHGVVPNTGKPITIAEYKSLAATKRPKVCAYRLAFKLMQRGDTLSAPSVVVKPRQRALIEIMREFRYPVAFEIPRAGKGNSLTPTTPTTFETTNTGVSIDVTPNGDGAFILLTGEATQTTFDGFRQNAGEAFRPITAADGTIISSNAVQSPTFTTRRTPFVVAALPGHSYRFPMNADKKTAIEVTCEEVR